MPWSDWATLTTETSELRLEPTLYSGQAFRWSLNDQGVHVGMVGSHVVHLREVGSNVQWKCATFDDYNAKIVENALKNYFQLDISLASLVQKWSKADSRFPDHLQGLRVMRQDPLECLFSFICSQNNNVGRITSLVNTLCVSYGSKIVTDDGLIHAFPTLDQLAVATEEDLRGLGFGYRARYIVESTKQVLAKGGIDWLNKLRSASSVSECTAALMQLTGVGRKVADCVSLYSLDKADCLPVDTHVWDVASTYDKTFAKSKNSTLTPALHDAIREMFVSMYGAHAGWAQSMLFAAELPKFREKKRRRLDEGEKVKRAVVELKQNSET